MRVQAADLGFGIGWRPELALAIDRRPDLGFVEVIAESLDPDGPLPRPLEHLRQRGVAVVPHGITLSLGSADPPDSKRLQALGRLAVRLGAPLVSEHVSFVRGGGLESGHLLPLPWTRAALEVLIANVQVAREALPVPLALENVATLFEWPHPEMDEAGFLAELVERTGVYLLLDLENVYANARNHGGDPLAFIERLPLDRIAYVHIAGGIECDGLYHDTHAHRVPQDVFDLLEELAARTAVSGAMLERDSIFPTDAEIHAELDHIAAALNRGALRREGCHVPG